MRKGIKILALVVISMLLSCSTVRVDKMSMDRVDYNGSEIKISGFYFREHWDDNSIYAHTILVFYQNGVYLNKLIYSKDLQEVIEYLNDNRLVSGSKIDSGPQNIYRLPFNWGIYKVEKQKVLYERWISTPGWARYKTVSSYSDIIDAETLKDSIRGDIYSYKEYYPKPDSISCFFPELLSKKDCKILRKRLESR